MRTDIDTELSMSPSGSSPPTRSLTPIGAAMRDRIITKDSNVVSVSRRNSRRRRFRSASLLVVAVAISACGSDDDSTASSASAPVTPAPAETSAPGQTSAPAETSAPPQTSARAESVGDTDDELCALAQEIFELDGIPAAEMLERYRSLAPSEIEAAVDLASRELIGAGDDVVAQLNVVGDDEVEGAIDEINAWEETNCAIPHAESAMLPPGATRDIDTAAARVDVTASDFAFDVGDVTAGRTSFVMTNTGVEAHFLAIFKLADGVTLEQFMSSDDDSLSEGFWETGVGAGGGDEETITFDVEPGNYAMVCFLPTKDGTPHAMLGMTREIVVSS